MLPVHSPCILHFSLLCSIDPVGLIQHSCRVPIALVASRLDFERTLAYSWYQISKGEFNIKGGMEEKKEEKKKERNEERKKGRKEERSIPPIVKPPCMDHQVLVEYLIKFIHNVKRMF